MPLLRERIASALRQHPSSSTVPIERHDAITVIERMEVIDALADTFEARFLRSNDVTYDDAARRLREVAA